MRHGARSTCGVAPGQTTEQFGAEWMQCHNETINEPMTSPNRGPCYPGQLSIAGEEMCFELGNRLRARYNQDLGLIGDSFDESTMHFESTTYARARLSLRRALDAMFPAKAVPQEYLDARQDSESILHPDIARCSNLMKMFLTTQKEVSESIKNDTELLDMAHKINTAFGSPIMDKVTWIQLGDWATSRAFHGLPLIPNLPEDFLPITEGAAWRSFGTILTDSTDTVRLGIGRLVSTIVDRMDARSLGKDETKFVIYSGHDTTIGPLSHALGIPLLSWPPYSTHIEVELWKSKLASIADGHRDVCLHGTNSGSIGEHSAEHMLSPAPLDTLPAYGMSQNTAGITAPVNGALLPHVSASRNKPTPFVDEYWVRVIFNGSVVSALPLTNFKTQTAIFKDYDNEKRKKDCGELDPSLTFQWQ